MTPATILCLKEGSGVFLRCLVVGEMVDIARRRSVFSLSYFGSQRFLVF